MLFVSAGAFTMEHSCFITAPDQSLEDTTPALLTNFCHKGTSAQVQLLRNAELVPPAEPHKAPNSNDSVAVPAENCPDHR
jgi:hypothetical protein